MKVGKEKSVRILFLSISLMVLIINNIYSQQPKCCYKENLISGNINIQLPCCYKLKKTNYDEGVFLIFNYKDSTAVTIFDGVLMNFPFFNEEEGYIPCKIDTVENRIIISGIKENKFWREDAITNRIRVMYVNVPSYKKEIYDEVLNSFYVTSKEDQ